MGVSSFFDVFALDFAAFSATDSPALSCSVESTDRLAGSLPQPRRSRDFAAVPRSQRARG